MVNHHQVEVACNLYFMMRSGRLGSLCPTFSSRDILAYRTHRLVVWSVGSHYSGIDFEVVGRGHAPRRSESDILAIESASARGSEALASKVPGASIHHQCQSSRV